MRARVLSLFLLVFAAACAASAGGGGGNSTLLTAADLEANAISPGEPLYDTINRMRPQWLQIRSGTPEPAVFIDGANAGSLQTLRTVNAGNVQEVRYYRPEQSASRYGGGFEGGVIEVTRRE